MELDSQGLFCGKVGERGGGGEGRGGEREGGGEGGGGEKGRGRGRGRGRVKAHDNGKNDKEQDL